MKNFLLICLFLAVAFAANFRYKEREHKNAFLGWMKQHKKSYSADEFQTRFAVFKSNYDFIKTWDADANGFHVALNEFADLSGAEFKKLYHNMNIIVDPATMVKDDEFQAPLTTTPTSVDWRQKGAVTPIKNQGQCGSCWSFSTTGSVEGCHYLAVKTLVSFSEQNLVDCSTAEGNQGCNGGLMDDAFQYIIKNKGLDTESSYPYTATGPNACKYKSSNSGGYITGYKDIPSGSESALIAAAGSIGPISVAIDASQNSFQFYSSGIYYAPGCSSTQLDHGVLVVGYGSVNSTTAVAAKPTPTPTTPTTTKTPTTPTTTTKTPTTPSPTDSPTPSPTDSPSDSPSDSPTPSPTDSPSDSPTPSPTDSPSDSPTPSPTDSPTPSPTDSPSDSPPSPTTDSPNPGPSPPPGPSKSGQYYIVKNSWGTSWGMQGYIWMSRNRNNNCGIATAASYPTGCVNP